MKDPEDEVAVPVEVESLQKVPVGADVWSRFRKWEAVVQ